MSFNVEKPQTKHQPAMQCNCSGYWMLDTGWTEFVVLDLDNNCQCQLPEINIRSNKANSQSSPVGRIPGVIKMIHALQRIRTQTQRYKRELRTSQSRERERMYDYPHHLHLKQVCSTNPVLVQRKHIPPHISSSNRELTRVFGLQFHLLPLVHSFSNTSCQMKGPQNF
jgi:hypothetical protein